MRSQGIIAEPKFIGIDVVRVRSNESTEAVERTYKPPQGSPPSTIRLTPDRQVQSWRSKEQNSIFRTAPTATASEIPDMFSIKRCLAFDEEDED
jgi:hypothetical protein